MIKSDRIKTIEITLDLGELRERDAIIAAEINTGVDYDKSVSVSAHLIAIHVWNNAALGFQDITYLADSPSIRQRIETIFETEYLKILNKGDAHLLSFDDKKYDTNKDERLDGPDDAA